MTIGNVQTGAVAASVVKQQITALAARLANAEARLQQRDQEQAADAELVGRLLAEVAERDRNVRDRDARILALEDEIARLRVDLVAARGRAEASPVSPSSRARRELAWLLDTASSTLEETRAASDAATTRLEDSRVVFDRLRGDGSRGDADAQSSIVAVLRQSAHLRDLFARIDRTIDRAADEVREADRSPARDADARAARCAEELSTMMLQLRAGIAPLLATDSRDSVPPRRRITPARTKPPKGR